MADHYDDFVADTPLCDLDDQIVRQTLPCPPNDRDEIVLDLGCGTGRTAIALAERGYTVVGVDLSAPMLDVLVHKSQSLGFSRVHAVRANLVQLECFADHSIDHAVCLFSTLGMIQGRENRNAMLRHVARIVRPGGKLILHVHHRMAALHEPGGVARMVRSWFRWLGDRNHELGDATYAYRGLEKMFMHRFSRRELQSSLSCCGWQIETMHLVSIDGSETTDSLRKAGGFIAISTVGRG
ncbi:MAG: methyltransferase domain-containing protein [Pirellulaceae bacterium]|nr:methyltransferase domain-containing protein [Pirellulaceae bacterium]